MLLLRSAAENLREKLKTISNSSVATPMRNFTLELGPTNDPESALGTHEKVGTTEIVLFYFPGNQTSEERATIMGAVDHMRPVMERSESLGLWDGWSDERDAPNPANPEPEQCVVFVNIVGWVNKDAHMSFQGSQDFADNIHHLMGLKDVRNNEIYHVAFKKFGGAAAA